MQSALPPVIERHELKYAIPWSYVEPISRFIAPYCEPDYHSSVSESNFYLVNSLYFDTRGLEFLQQRMHGKDGRFNVRVRCYGEQGEAPYFLEIKRKSGFTGVKYRSVATAEEWPNILTDASYQLPRSGSDMINYDNETIYSKDYTSDTSVILELKSNIGEVPTWMLDLITSFDLQQQGFSKYMSSSLVSHFDDGISYMSTDRKARYYADN